MSSPQENMLLWLPANKLEDEEFDFLAEKVTKSNDSILDFCDREISFDQMLEVIDYYDADVEDYCRILDANLRNFGV